VASLAVAANLPVMVVEGVITAFCIAFLKKVEPGLLPGRCPAPVAAATPADISACEEVADAP
jgi:cobalt/nickel transport system permease protein